jgi:uncharacterized protein
MNLLLRILFICSVVILSDVYFYRLVRQTFLTTDKWIRSLKIFCIVFTVCFLIFVLSVYSIVGFPEDDFIKYRQLFLVLDAFVLVYLPKSISAIIILVYDVLRFLLNLTRRLSYKKDNLAKSKFIYRIAMFLYFAVLVFTVYGFVYEKSDFKIQKVDLNFRNLPKSFEGFTIVQISDLHLGSYTDTKTFEKAVNLIKSLHADLFFMTGDIVNVSYKEVLPFTSYFNSINPPFGKISILGNHDIGDYFSLKFPKNQEQLTNSLIATEKNEGFKLLIDSSLYLRKGNDSIAIIGTNNCGDFPFKHTGNLNKALQNTKKSDFKILLSHDPDEWKDEVLGKTNIDLTLSGHTHAMQLAFICGSIHLSPSAIRYKHWYGLYQTGQQYLYVNPGLGYSGFAGRIGIRPEITLITLHCIN